MEHDLTRYPRLLAKLLTGQPLPLSCSVQGYISVWDLAHLGRRLHIVISPHMHA